MQSPPQRRRRRSCVDNSNNNNSHTMITTATSEHYSEHHHLHKNDNEENVTPKRRGKRRVLVTKVPPHILAQKHNDKGVSCVELGQYEEATANFIKAFKFSQLDNAPSCTCCHCSVLSAVLRSTDNCNFFRINSLLENEEEEEEEESDDEFLYSTAIRMPEKSQGHSMGRTFQILLAFNLALANHLSWAMKRDVHDLKKLKRILQLYELAYNLQMEESVDEECSNTIIMRFKLIILNNLSQIYRAINENEQHQFVLEHLLSQLMVIVVTEQRNSNQTNVPTLAIEASANSMDLHGVFKSVSSILFKKSCARAA